jgi:hypothetical protein
MLPLVEEKPYDLLLICVNYKTFLYFEYSLMPNPQRHLFNVNLSMVDDLNI